MLLLARFLEITIKIEECPLCTERGSAGSPCLPLPLCTDRRSLCPSNEVKLSFSG